MKNLTKIFFAVVAGMFAFSCVTDTTNDPTIEVGNSVNTVITVSLEESKTQLGDKDAQGKYPLYWTAGDAIAVNGVASQPLSESYEGKASAAFNFAGEVVRPFSAVYPAPAEGVTAAEGLYPVTFLATQAYTEGTFASGAAPMYGYAEAAAEGEAELPLQLNHLTGVLRFAIKGDKVLSSIVITAEAPIAGNFDVNCQTGELTAHADASNTVTVTFGDGLALGAEATPIYVAVPAGTHGLYTITINSTEGETMVVKYNSENKPVNVGVVKEFGEFLYVPNTAAAPQGELIITNETDMKNLSTWAADGMLGEVTSVKVAGNIDMSKIANWAPIVNFPAITFDGGSAEGYAISGLTAPLFEAVDGATIQNVKLTGVNITETARLHVGSLVCDAANTTISNCSAEGALTYTCGTAITGATNTAHGVGGMIGALTGASTLTGSTNSINVTITKYAASCDTKVYNPFGAMVGYAYGTSSKHLVISECTNLGSITSKVKSITNVQPAMAAFVGYAHFVDFTNITNGKEGDTTCGNATFELAQSCVGAGAVIGAAKNININGITNYGSLTYKASISYPYVAAVIGTWWANDSKANSTVANVTNYGNLTAAKVTGKDGTPNIGGIIGRSATSSSVITLKDCVNHGDITISTNHALTKSNCLCMGGIVGAATNVVFDNCDNNGVITLDGTVNTDVTLADLASLLYFGGIVGKHDAGTLTLCDNNGSLNINTTVFQAHIGGVVGYSKATSFTKNHNHGDLTVAGTILKNTGICGMGSSLNSCALDECSNTGDITVSVSQPKSSAGAYYICGLGWTSSPAHKNFTNSGNITFTGVNYKNVFMSGALYTPSKGHKNIHNTGTIKANVKDLAAPLQIGGIGRTMSGGSFENCTNSGDIIFEGNTTNAVYLGGLAAVIDGAITTVGEGCTNSGNIKFLGTTTKAAGAGGIAGKIAQTVTSITTLKNTGTVTNYDATSNKIGKGGTEFYMAGCIGYTTVAQSVAMVNTGDVYVRNAEGGVGALAYVGGVVGRTDALISNAKADCDVAAIGLVEAKDQVGVGMITGVHRGSSALVDKCKVGGRYALVEKEGQPDWITLSEILFQEEDSNGEFEQIPGFAPYWTKIYGGAWADADGENCDGCTYESANPAVQPESGN